MNNIVKTIGSQSNSVVSGSVSGTYGRDGSASSEKLSIGVDLQAIELDKHRDRFSSFINSQLKVDSIKCDELMISQPPPCNTGAVVPFRKSRIGIGWVTLSFKCGEPDHVQFSVDFLAKVYLKHTFDEINERGLTYRGYKCAVRTYFGAYLCWTPGRADYLLVLPQSVIERFYLYQLVPLLVDLCDMGGKVTRLDLSVDDFSGVLTMDLFNQAFDRKDYVGRTRDVLPLRKRDIRTGALRSDSILVGNRQSDVYIRIYDKNLESKGKENCIRVELELKQKPAQAALRQILEASAVFHSQGREFKEIDLAEFVRVTWGVILGKIDFRDRQSDDRINRRTRLPWWEEFNSMVQAIKLETVKKEDGIGRVKEWFERSVAPSLALLLDAAGNKGLEWLEEQIEIGRSKQKARHRSMLREVS